MANSSTYLRRHQLGHDDLARPAPPHSRSNHKRMDGLHGSNGSSRILIHAINFAPELIGCAKYTTELAQFLDEGGNQVEVVTAPPHYPGWFAREPYNAWSYRRESMGGIKISRCPMLMKKDGGGLWRLLAPMTFAIAAAPMVVWRILRFRPDVVMCVEPTLFSAPAAMIAAKLVGARTLLHVQDLEVDAAFEVGHIKGKALRGAARFLERALLGAFDRIVTISEKMRGALIGKGLPRSKVEVLRNWVDLDAIKPWPVHRGSAFRAQLGIDAELFVVLYAGHVGVKQALDVVLDAARQLVSQEAVHFVIAGEGPKKAWLRTAYGDLPNVSYLPLQPAERLDELLSMADLHVLPQHKGAADLVLPSKLGGMLASGRPIVATVDGGTELSDILTGVALLTPAGDSTALAEAISRAKDMDLSGHVEKGLRVAETLSSRRLLPLFERALTEDSPWSEEEAGQSPNRADWGAESMRAAPAAAE